MRGGETLLLWSCTLCTDHMWKCKKKMREKECISYDKESRYMWLECSHNKYISCKTLRFGYSKFQVLCFKLIMGDSVTGDTNTYSV